MEKKVNRKTSQDKIVTVAYSILLGVFKKKISTRKTKTLKYSNLKSSDRAKCNDLVQKVLKFTVYLDPWINKNKKGRLRIELICLVRLALIDVLIRNVRQETVLKKYSDLAASYERTKYSKNQLRYLIHLAYSNLENNALTPIFLFEKKLRKVLLDQYCLEKVKKVERIFSKPPPIDLYFKKRALNEYYMKQLQGSSVHLSHFRLSQNISLKETKGYFEGDWWVQSLAASLPIKMAPMTFKGKTVLDVCCAPGGKSFQLVDMGAILTSIDKSEKRLEIMRGSLSRLNYDFDLINMDVFEYEPKKMFDIILLDPPCTATGTIGKNPDLQFFDPLEKLDELIKVQQKMLERCSRWLTDNGFLIYSVCSLLKEEGENQINKFLTNNKRFISANLIKQDQLKQDGLEIQKDRGIRIMPFYEENIGGTEGFYIAYLQVKGSK
ncbi:RsmB/NOP family class I SAM-dependent RNA methyltransferase [Paracoccaceae bacterium]|nr:RsmB/NOP family class I SAM-dependent RNA methyltransferase [Paracoccaceae bacterium]